VEFGLADQQPTGPQPNAARTLLTISHQEGGSMQKHRSRPADPTAAQEDGPARPPDGFVAQGVNFTKRFVRARITKPEATPVAEIAPGQAKVISADGDKVAAYRDDGGTLHAVSAVCTHMGCVVDWNAGEKTWDCPCHGSRFDFDGHVIRGPAKRELEGKPIEVTSEARA
jgi:Rieske Fe-S protein